MADIALITGAVVAILTALSAFIVKIHLKKLRLCCIQATCLKSPSVSRATSGALPELQYDDTDMPLPVKIPAL